MFEIQKWVISPKKNSIEFHFKCETYGKFCEVITLPEKANLAAHSNDTTLNQLLDIMAAYLGVSYYKLSAEKQITFNFPYFENTIKSIEALYTKGLGEFYVRNKLEYPPHLEFSYSAKKTKNRNPATHTKKKENCATVAFGGGKDSHVSISLLENLGIKHELISVVLAKSVQNTLQKLSHKNVIFIKRKIDPKLIVLGKESKGYNGHIPITAINSIILSVYSYLTGNEWVIFSNERGASVPTMHHGAHEINHQYSKSIEFERLFKDSIKEICGNKLQYFSMLRPFSELWIAAYLAKNALIAHKYFSSCNRNFIFKGHNKLEAGERWCGTCSKCVYTAIITAPHLPKEDFLNIFGDNILNDPENIQTAKDLCGIGTRKPWECVGDFIDTAAALFSLSSKEEWAQDKLPQSLQKSLIKKYGESILKERPTLEIDSRSEHFLPDKFLEIL